MMEKIKSFFTDLMGAITGKKKKEEKFMNIMVFIIQGY